LTIKNRGKVTAWRKWERLYMMDRAVKKQIISMLDDVADVIMYVGNSKAIEELAVCQVALESIRALCEKDFSTNAFELYDEILSAMLVALEQLRNDEVAGDEIEDTYKLLSELIVHVKNHLAGEKEIKKEIVFLPYKAVMWDSFDTIWRAAVLDKEHCNAYVVPIPYADRTQDGKAIAWHHEMDLFPEDVPVLDYREFDIQALHPDVIFIHNPYDGKNAITSVEPSFFSYQLKKYTDKLVYVPYFVSGEAVSKEMCEASALQYVDYAIVESEKIKKTYEENYPFGVVPKDKFLALGSPKYDKVTMSKKEDYTLPVKWREMVNNKKIVLYATTLGDQLKNYDHAIDKLQHILDFFRKRDDVVLWWRPHPLLQNTLDVMRPSISKQYWEIVAKYQQDCWGIYDDTPDAHRAMAWSDAYYGDWSSLICLYKETGKPIMVNDFLSFDDKPVGKVFFYSCYVEKNLLYFVPITTDLLCVYDLEKQEMIWAMPIEHGHSCGTDSTFANVVKAGNKVLLCPWKEASDEFVEYDLETKKHRSISCMNLDSRIKGYKFLQYFWYKNACYLVGYNFFGIVVYEPVSGTFKADGQILGFDAPHRNDGAFCWYIAQQINNRLYILAVATDCVIEVDLDNGSITRHTIANGGNKLNSIYKYKGGLLFVADNNELVFWNISKNEIKTIILKNTNDGDSRCTGLGIYNEIIYMFFTDSDNHFSYSEVLIKENRATQRRYLNGIDLITYFRMQSEHKCYLGGIAGGKTFFGLVDFLSGQVTRYNMEIPQEILEKNARKSLREEILSCEGKSIILQEAFYSLEVLCDELVSGNITVRERKNFVTAGEKIYKKFILGDVK